MHVFLRCWQIFMILARLSLHPGHKATTGKHTLSLSHLSHKEKTIMELSLSSKKIMLATILTSGIALAISQAALSQPAPEEGQGKPNVTSHRPHRDPAMQKAREQFLTDTVAIRKQLAEKNAAMRVLLNAGTPDTDKASQLAGDLFELREKLRAKAIAAGLSHHMLLIEHDDMMNTMPCQDYEYRHHRNRK